VSRGTTAALLLVAAVLVVCAVVRQVTDGSADFREFWDASGHRVLGVPLNDPRVTVPFTYPPSFLVLIAPLAALPLPVAAAIWAVLALLAGWLAVRDLDARAAVEAHPWIAGPAALAIVALGLDDVLMGNVNLWVLAAWTGATRGAVERRPAVAAGWLGLGVAIKLLPAPLAAVIAAAGAPLAAMFGLAGAGAAIAASCAPFGACGSWLVRIGVLDGDRWQDRDDAWRPVNQSIAAVAHRHVDDALAGQLAFGLGIAAIVAATGRLAMLRGAEPHAAWTWRASALVALLVLLLSPVSWVNYQLLAAPALAWLARELHDRPEHGRIATVGLLGWGALAILGVAEPFRAAGAYTAGTVVLAIALAAAQPSARR
jgi:hypothetical protein